MSFQDPSCYMVDLSSAPSTCLLSAEFDRTAFPVRYYFTNLSHATKIELPSTPVQTSSTTTPFRHDVQDCGVMIDRLLVHVSFCFLLSFPLFYFNLQVPRIGPKFKSLVKAMAVGGFGADDARKLFEALCKSLESSTFDTPVPRQEHVSCSSTCYSSRNNTPPRI